MTPLESRIRELSTPLTPQPTGAEELLPWVDGIRAVVFDVYGTLLISGSGDISLTSGASKGAAAAEALAACGGGVPAEGDSIVQALLDTIRTHHKEAASEFPEVEIREVWRQTLDQLGVTPEVLAGLDLDRLAVEYECRVNPIWPMPGMTDCLETLRQAGMRLGIVSNAQFFTPVSMSALADASMAQLGFEPEYCVWSYKHLRAKPGRFLYDRIAESLARHGMQPGEVLYVGNDMRNDVAPAALVGFRTALFAGDARSLRLREGDPMVEKVRPDAVITDLGQILSILSLA